jgi:hypothetical protein
MLLTSVLAAYILPMCKETSYSAPSLLVGIHGQYVRLPEWSRSESSKRNKDDGKDNTYDVVRVISLFHDDNLATKRARWLKSLQT